ncbi:MAG: L-glutamate gamma-semialdehyde dehydrogenase [Candidatus Riflebacteria bacterium]|jgi:1-pyrroline-5-carboxylate dehydrogenase|nr:L-glutamate gamma-semialdehyde dehydrogenase [Candidatus Riflebacteria bacterium]
MNNAVFNIKMPANEPILGYLKGSKEEKALTAELQRQADTVIEIPLIINGKEVKTGKIGEFRMPCDHKHILARYHMAGEKEVQAAIDAACEAQKTWSNVPWQDRAAVALKIARLLADKYRAVINAATMLGQGKNIYQAEIDSACETIDFLRFNASFMSQIYAEQPLSDATQMNRIEYRSLEGFVFALSPFNFTAIASNLSMSPALMGNGVVWKPATTAILSNYYLMQVYKEAGLPDGVINFLPGQGSQIGSVIFNDPRLAGIHFTGSSSTFNSLWQEIGKNLGKYRSYPKIVGETGGKDFIVVHESADLDAAATGIVRGSFEYQGQKCSACSRVYAPASKWPAIKNRALNMLSEIKMGDVREYGNFVNAVIDEKSFDSIMKYIELAKADKSASIVAGGKGSKEKGYFIEPTIIETTDPNFITMREEIFGPVVTVYVYEDSRYEETLKLCDSTSPYALTGAVFSRDRQAILRAYELLRYAAGNFYINDKCTGAVVGMQPFGGGRGSGTNDKAGAMLNLLRWTSPRAIKETYLPATNYPYPYME